MCTPRNQSFKINGFNKCNFSSESDEVTELEYNVILGYNTIVMGSHKSGKTSILNKLVLKLEISYNVYRVSFQHGLEEELSSFFFKSIGFNGQESQNIKNLCCSSGEERGVVLIFDDFHNILGHKNIQSFLLLLKRLREYTEYGYTSKVISIVIFGNYDLFKISSLLDRFIALTPVSFESLVFIANKTKDQTFSLLKGWSNLKSVSISDEVLNELWLLSNGNLHLISIIGITLERLRTFDNYKSFDNIDCLKKPIIELIKHQQQFNFLKSYITKSSLVDKVNGIQSKISSISEISFNDLIVLSNFGLFYYKDSKFHISGPILLEYLFGDPLVL